MVWRGRSSALDRFWACIVYTLPLIEALVYAEPFFSMFPFARLLFIPLVPFQLVYAFVAGLFSFGSISLGGLIIFFALLLLVVRNHRINHFIRFNTMQALIIGIAVSLFGLVWFYLFDRFAPSLVTEVVFNTLFLGVLVAVLYSVVQTARGLYAEIPVVSEAAYVQTRY